MSQHREKGAVFSLERYCFHIIDERLQVLYDQVTVQQMDGKGTEHTPCLLPVTLLNHWAVGLWLSEWGRALKRNVWTWLPLTARMIVTHEAYTSYL